MKWLRWLSLLAVLISLLVPVEVWAGTSDDVTITAAGIIVAAPGAFTLTYISDWEIGISWVKAPGADKTMVRAAFGHVPSSISDGYQVYYDVGTSCNDTAVSLGASEVVYYRAWSQLLSGVWGPLFASGSTEEFMSASFLFIAWMALGCFLLWLETRRPNILLMLAGFATWLSLGFWVLLGGITNLNLANSWVQIFTWVPFILAFVVPLLHMNIEIRQEQQGHSWSVFGNEPKGQAPTPYEQYRDILYQRRQARRNR